MWGHGWDYGPGWWMWGLMLLGTIGFWLIVAYVVRTVILGRRSDDTRSAAKSAEPLRLLDERLARGEIDVEQYERTKDVLKSPH